MRHQILCAFFFLVISATTRQAEITSAQYSLEQIVDLVFEHFAGGRSRITIKQLSKIEQIRAIGVDLAQLDFNNDGTLTREELVFVIRDRMQHAAAEDIDYDAVRTVSGMAAQLAADAEC